MSACDIVFEWYCSYLCVSACEEKINSLSRKLRMYFSTAYIQFSKDVNYADNQNIVVLFWKIICYHNLRFMCITIALENIEDLILVDDKLPSKTAKITSIKNLDAYSMMNIAIRTSAVCPSTTESILSNCK